MSERKNSAWGSRHHRKSLRLVQALEDELATASYPAALFSARALFGERGVFSSHSLNWWIGSIFALGAAFFAVACVAFLVPQWAAALALSPSFINCLFFAGSIPFTTAAYLQLYQAANADAVPTRRRLVFGFDPGNIGWLSCALQFVGTVLFNFNTFDALLPGLSWQQEDLLIWGPNIVGSVLFLSSGYLAFVETCGSYFAFKPRNLQWTIVFINLLGCVGFMIAAVFGIFLPGPANAQSEFLSLAFTLQGAICFFAGSLLMLPEAKLGQASHQAISPSHSTLD